jgi:S1-C subfamily serine protease
MVQIQAWSPQIDHLLQPMGTGFFVNREGYVVTAGHVIAGGNALLSKIPGDKKNLSAGVPYEADENGHIVLYPGSFAPLQFNVVELDQRADVALLKLKSNPFDANFSFGQLDGKPIRVQPTSVEFSLKDPEEGAAVAVSGYPFGNPTLITNSGTVASIAYSILGRPSMADFPGNTYLLDLEADHGNSGGPVYLAASGSVIGVCLGGFKHAVVDKQDVPAKLEDGTELFYKSRMTMSVPARYVVELLKKNHVDFASH